VLAVAVLTARHAQIVPEDRLNIALLQTCKLVHDEYYKTWQRDSKGFEIFALGENHVQRLNVAMGDIPLVPTFPTSVFSQTRRITLYLHLLSVVGISRRSARRAFVNRQALSISGSAEGSPDVAWTPTAGLVHSLREVLQQLASWVPGSATIVIHLVWTEGLNRLISTMMDAQLCFSAVPALLHASSGDLFSIAPSIRLATTAPVHTEIEHDSWTPCDPNSAARRAVQCIERPEGEYQVWRSDHGQYEASDAEAQCTWYLSPLPDCNATAAGTLFGSVPERAYYPG